MDWTACGPQKKKNLIRLFLFCPKKKTFFFAAFRAFPTLRTPIKVPMWNQLLYKPMACFAVGLDGLRATKKKKLNSIIFILPKEKNFFSLNRSHSMNSRLAYTCVILQTSQNDSLQCFLMRFLLHQKVLLILKLCLLLGLLDFLVLRKKKNCVKSFWNVTFPTSLCAAAFEMFKAFEIPSL